MFQVARPQILGRLFAVGCLLAGGHRATAQCIDKEKITRGGEWEFTTYVHRCPIYQFACGGTDSKEWGVLNDPISMSQAPAIILRLKQRVEDSIRHYAGAKFYRQLRFNAVEMVVPEQLGHFKKEGRQDVTLEYCKAVYFFYYEFKPDSLATVHYSVAVDQHRRTISPFKLPKVSEYQPIDPSFSYCQLHASNFQHAFELVQAAKQQHPELNLTKSYVNNWGYALARHHQPQQALALFKLNVQLFPNGWNTYDSLAEAYELAGNHALAIENYRRAVALNPRNANGVARLKKLGELTPRQ